MTNLALYLVPTAIAALTLGAARLTAGNEGWVRYSAAALAAAFIAGWALVVAPGWGAYDSITRIGHIVVGAALVGVSLDVFWPALIWRRFLIGGFAAGCAWLSVSGSFSPDGLDAAAVAQMVALTAVWAITSLRLIAVQAHPPTGLVLLFVALASVAVAAGVSGSDPALLSAAALLTAALLALAVAILVGQIAVSPGAALVVSAVVMAVGWAVTEAVPGAWLGLAVMAFIPFADRTARRVPMPDGGISAVLYVLALIGIAAIPAVLGALTVLAAAARMS